MAPSFTLRGPSPSNLSLPRVDWNGNPLASPSSASRKSGPISPALSNASPTNEGGYFSPPNRAPPPLVSKEDAFRTVKAMEATLAAWNEYRVAISAMGKAGRKLAAVTKDLVACMDKTEIPVQTMRPAATLLDTVADVTIKLAKRIDKEYDDVNSDAAKYFALLAKETRSHDAYLGAIGKKHDKAEKAYRKASKSLSDTSNAHAGFVSLKDNLGADIRRANADHMTFIGTKQAALLFRLASGSGLLASNLVSYFSESLRKAGGGYCEIEYFRALADIHWRGRVPQDVEDGVEEARREEIRLGKARVTLGEMDVVGPQIWAGVTVADDSVVHRSPGPAVSLPKGTPSNVLSQKNNLRNREVDRAPTDASPNSNKQTWDSVEPPNLEAEAAYPIGLQRKNSRSSQQPLVSAVNTPSSTASSAFPKHGSDQSHVTTSQSFVSEVIPLQAVQATRIQPETLSGNDMRPHRESQRLIDSVTRPIDRYFDHEPGGFIADTRQNQDIKRGHTARANSVVIPAVKRTVSQIAADMEIRAHGERKAAFDAHRLHGIYVRGCQLCAADYERMIAQDDNQRRRHALQGVGSTQVGWKDVGIESMGSNLISRAHVARQSWSPGQPQVPEDSARSSYARPLEAPRPLRANKLSPDLEEFGAR